MPSVCDSEEFEVIDECVCPGYTTAVYKCTAVGSGFTQWAGSAFSCPNIGDEIFLSHNDFNDGIRKECNNGAIIGQSIRVNGSCFTSLLIVNISANLNGATIGCTYDTGSTLQLIGETILANRAGIYHDTYLYNFRTFIYCITEIFSWQNFFALFAPFHIGLSHKFFVGRKFVL